MPSGDAPLAAAVHHRMSSDRRTVLQDDHRAGGELHLHSALEGAVRYGVEIAAERHHAVAGGRAAFDLLRARVPDHA